MSDSIEGSSGSGQAAIRLAAAAHGVRVGRFCSSCLGASQAGQEALVETFVAAAAAAGQRPADLAVQVWLIGLARGICARRLEEEAPAGQPSGTTDLRQALAALKPTQREALLARTVAGLSFADVARAFATDQTIIVERASRGLEQLRLALQPGESAPCHELAHHLAAVADGDAEVLVRHAAHLATCDACRDLRHDARQLLAQLGGLASDFQPAADFSAKVEAALAGSQPVLAAASTTVPADRPAAAASPASPASVAAPASATVPANQPLPAAPPVRSVSIKKRIGLFLGLTAVGVLIALWLAEARRHDGPGPALTSSSFRVARIVRAAADAKPGLFERASQGAAERSLVAGETVSSGVTLRTDARTRAWLQSKAGVEVAMDHGTVLGLGRGGAELSLDRGEIVMEASQASQRLQVQGGWLELEQGRGSITASADSVSVRVLWGRAVVHGRGDTPVAAGQEALLARDGQIRTATALGLAGLNAWSETGADGEAEAEAEAPGLGELRARRPGDARKREQPLRLAEHKVTVRILGPVARTEIDETFQNDGVDTLEGTYRFPLPADAQLERLALEVDGQLQEGSFVERERAAAIWRGVLHHATPLAPKPIEEMIWVPGPWRDPALLEWQRGGRFELRIFPIPPHRSRRVIVAYTQAIAPQGEGRRYVYPLPHAANRASEVGHFQLDVRVTGAHPDAPVKVRGYDLAVRRDEAATALSFERSSFFPTGDLIVDYQLPHPEAQMRTFTFQRRGDEPAYVMFALRPRLPAWTESKPRDHLLVVDSSQSMTGERWNRAARLATTLLAEMDRRDRVWLAVCDVGCRLLDARARTPSNQMAIAAKDFLARIRPAGSTDLFGALRSSVALVRGQLQAGRELQVLYLGDGMASVGYRTPGSLATQVRKLRSETPGLAISAVGIGSDADSAALDAVVRAGGGHLVAYRPGERVAVVAMKILESSYGVSLGDISLNWPAGIREVSPSSASTLREGEELVAFGRFSGEVKGTVELHGTVAGQPYLDRYPVDLQVSTAPANAFVPRMWAAATIARLELDSAQAAKAQIIDLSKSFAVLSRYTSLLVLESPAMMHAFGVEQNRVASNWSGEGELDGDESVGTEKQAGPTVQEAPGLDAVASVSGGGLKAEEEMRAVAKGGAGSARMAAPAPAAQASAAQDRRKSAESAMADGPAMGPPATVAKPMRADEMLRPAPRPGRWMHKVWTKEARVVSWQPRSWGPALAAAEQALRESPDSRDRHRKLVQLLSRNGDIERAQQIAEQWLERDRLDAEALTALADLLARQGEREEALRWLSGIVDLEPDNKALHERLARAYERLGAADRACSHRIVLAELSPSDFAAVGAALRCDRMTDWQGAADVFLPRLSSEVARRHAQGFALAMPPRAPAHGEVVLDATWNRGDDLDLALISPQGTRISWMGGRKSVFADRVADAGSERLGLGVVSPGSYLVEVSRTNTTELQPVRGRIRLSALGIRQDLPFSLAGRQVVAATLVVERKWHLEPVRPRW